MSIEEKLEQLDQERHVLEKDNGKALQAFWIIPMVFAVNLMLPMAIPVAIFLTVLAAVLAVVYYYNRIIWPFQRLVERFKSELIGEYMRSYHPKTTYQYQSDKKDVRSIIKKSNLISPNIYHEEDVVTGKHKGTHYYLSEIDLKRKSNKSTRRIFKGMMFKLTVPGRTFPRALIQSKVGLINKYLYNFNIHTEYGFHYATRNEATFENELGRLFPFIQYLIKQKGDVRIETGGDEILILLKSKDNFLDNPEPKLKQTFLNQDNFTNLVRQMNTLLYIVEAFSTDSEPSTIDEELELKMLELVKMEKDN
jgi:hypothetical protein